MFWVLWLPIAAFAVMLIFVIVDCIRWGFWHDFFNNLLMISLVTMLIFMVASVVSLIVATYVPAKTVYSDAENPVYLVQIPENKDNKYLISTEDLKQGEIYSYYFKNSDTGISELATIDRSKARVVFDSPTQPFFAEIKYTCAASKFWLIDCTNLSPYKIEFHLPEDSILK